MREPSPDTVIPSSAQPAAGDPNAVKLQDLQDELASIGGLMVDLEGRKQERLSDAAMALQVFEERRTEQSRAKAEYDVLQVIVDRLRRDVSFAELKRDKDLVSLERERENLEEAYQRQLEANREITDAATNLEVQEQLAVSNRQRFDILQNSLSQQQRNIAKLQQAANATAESVRKAQAAVDAVVETDDDGDSLSRDSVDVDSEDLTLTLTPQPASESTDLVVLAEESENARLQRELEVATTANTAAQKALTDAQEVRQKLDGEIAAHQTVMQRHLDGAFQQAVNRNTAALEEGDQANQNVDRQKENVQRFEGYVTESQAALEAAEAKIGDASERAEAARADYESFGDVVQAARGCVITAQRKVDNIDSELADCRSRRAVLVRDIQALTAVQVVGVDAEEGETNWGKPEPQVQPATVKKGWWGKPKPALRIREVDRPMPEGLSEEQTERLQRERVVEDARRDAAAKEEAKKTKAARWGWGKGSFAFGCMAFAAFSIVRCVQNDPTIMEGVNGTTERNKIAAHNAREFCRNSPAVIAKLGNAGKQTLDAAIKAHGDFPFVNDWGLNAKVATGADGTYRVTVTTPSQISNLPTKITMTVGRTGHGIEDVVFYVPNSTGPGGMQSTSYLKADGLVLSEKSENNTPTDLILYHYSRKYSKTCGPLVSDSVKAVGFYPNLANKGPKP